MPEENETSVSPEEPTGSPITLTDSSDVVASTSSSVIVESSPATASGQSSGSSSSAGALEYHLIGHPYQMDMPDTKEGIDELCPVCGDKVSGYHYGLLTCESCKGFFKRTVQNKKVYTCVAERQCHIDKSQRKRCPFCRFQKCLDVGMKLEAVRADRMRGGRNKFGPMYKRDRARKLQMIRQRQQVANQHARVACQQLTSEAYPPGQTTSSSGVYAHSTSMKNELIQIPQLSSSTSSPDSSPSPLPQAIVSLAGSSLSVDMKSGAPWTNNGPSYHQKAFGGYEGTSSGASAAGGAPVKFPALIREFQQSVMDDKEWQGQMYNLLQSQTHNQCEVDLFELMCKVLDQSLFAQVDWARNSQFFKELKVDDQMKLLQHSWSDMLILDHIHQRLHNQLPDETTLSNGQKFDLLAVAVLGLTEQTEALAKLTAKLQELKFDPIDYTCLKFMLLLNPGMMTNNNSCYSVVGIETEGGEETTTLQQLGSGQNSSSSTTIITSIPDIRTLGNRKHVSDSYEQVKKALLDYSVMCYPHIQDKFGKFMELLPELRMIAMRGEEYLYYKHLNGGAPTQTLLMEMLHAKKK